MCFNRGGGGGDGGAAAAAQARTEQRQTEDDRQGRIRAGQGVIDDSFKQFTPDYYNNYKQTYTSATRPQVDDQYKIAQDQLYAALVGRGVDNSTIGGNATALLAKKKDTALGDIANAAGDASNTFQNNVEKSKSDLYSLNQASADPSSISARARGEAASLAPPQQYTQLGDLFSSVLQPVQAFTRANTYSPYGGQMASWFSPGPTSGSGSGRVTRG